MTRKIFQSDDQEIFGDVKEFVCVEKMG